jgi:hypothetical protein
MCVCVCKSTYHGNIEELLLSSELVERADSTHFVRFEALRVRTCIVHLDHARADIDADELGHVRRERTRDLT